MEQGIRILGFPQPAKQEASQNLRTRPFQDCLFPCIEPPHGFASNQRGLGKERQGGRQGGREGGREGGRVGREREAGGREGGEEGEQICQA